MAVTLMFTVFWDVTLCDAFLLEYMAFNCGYMKFEAGIITMTLITLL
jgi:hypothetical protein